MTDSESVRVEDAGEERPASVFVCMLLGALIAIGFGPAFLGPRWGLYAPGSSAGYVAVDVALLSLISLLVLGLFTVVPTALAYGLIPWLNARVCRGANLFWSIPAHLALGVALGLALPHAGVTPPPPPC